MITGSEVGGLVSPGQEVSGSQRQQCHTAAQSLQYVSFCAWQRCDHCEIPPHTYIASLMGTVCLVIDGTEQIQSTSLC